MNLVVTVFYPQNGSILSNEYEVSPPNDGRKVVTVEGNLMTIHTGNSSAMTFVIDKLFGWEIAPLA